MQLDDGQLAEAVAPYTVQWLCQHQLKEPLEVRTLIACRRMPNAVHNLWCTPVPSTFACTVLQWELWYFLMPAAQQPNVVENTIAGVVAMQMLASKLGQAPSTLLLGAADAVIAHMLWFSLDSLESFTRFVEAVMHPETFIAVVTVRSSSVALCYFLTGLISRFLSC